MSYTGIDGAATETLDVGSYITFIWDATGNYWVVDAGAFEKPTYISTTQTLTAVKKMIAVVNTLGVVLTLDAGPYDGFELPVLVTADCQIVYTGVNGSVTKNVQANTYNEFVWDSSNSGFWLPRESTAVTGIDDNGQPFAFNIDALTQADGVINITGTDADGNPFDYGVGKLVVAADENNYSTEEVKTSKTWIDGKPIYRRVFTGTISTYTDSSATRYFEVDIADWGTTHKLINTGGFFDLSTGQRYPFGSIYVETDKTVEFGSQVVSAAGLGIRFFVNMTRGVTSVDYNIILEYTKTTD